VSHRGRRRRSSRYRRRVRRSIAALAVVILVCFSVRLGSFVRSAWLSHTYLSKSEDSAWAREDPSRSLSVWAAETASGPIVIPRRVVYPYSVIPGGVRTPEDLRQVSEHDPVVGGHYPGFDFQHARIIELDQPKLVYLSYRLGDRVFWTKKKVSLRKGEKLITDGKITARTRCANRVSEVAQPAVSAEEPPAGKFEEPLLEGGSATQVPFPEARNLFALGPVAPPGAPRNTPPMGFGLPPLYPPPIPPQGCIPTKSKGKEEDIADLKAGKSKPCPTPPPTPPPIPEPGTILLVSSGIAGVYLRRRAAAKK